MKASQAILMAISVPILILGWAFAAIGIYYLAAALFGLSTAEDEQSLAAIWNFIFSFVAASIAGLFASKAGFASNALMRKIYVYSIEVSAVLFLGFSSFGLLAGLYSMVFKS